MQIISVSETAQDYIASKITSQAKETGQDISGMRVSIEKGGCSGQKYVFDYVTAPEKGDQEISMKDHKIYIDPAAILYLFGSEMDYKETDFSSELVFTNPNESGRCGCGESVTF